MIDDLIDTKADSLVLGFFVAAPKRAFSVFEIAKRIKQPKFKVGRALNKLASRNILNAFFKRGRKYHIMNLKYYLYPKLEESFKKNRVKYNDELFTAIKSLGKLRAAFLSGIFTGNANLPVDILLVGRVNLKKLDAFLKSAKKLMGQEINYSLMSAKEFEQRRDTFDKFIKDIFDYRNLTVVDKLIKK